MFYPAAADSLRDQVDALLAAAPAGSGRGCPKALVVPHAGYVYSGPTAAAAYARLRSAGTTIRRVILLGPAHRVRVRGLATTTAHAFATPLGEVPIDLAGLASVTALPQVVQADDVHALEHALEVQLPFLQRVLGEFSLLPFAVGEAAPGAVAQVLDRLWGGQETLILISSDLSHFHPWDEAARLDRASVDSIIALDASLDHEQACGATPINGLLQCARQRGMRAELLDLRNSGDTAGDRARVVGYAAVAFYEPATALPDLGDTLLALARAAIQRHFGLRAQDPAPHPALADRAASFVTLTRDGELRGCIGSLNAHRPLGEDVRENALAAACRDPRFDPLRREELDRVRIEVSLLGEAEFMEAGGEEAALAQLRPGVDGVILFHGCQRATFLPQVWESLPNPRDFLGQLTRKAGLPPDYWSDKIQLARYAVRKWKEPERP
jgi:hypothetical protein